MKKTALLIVIALIAFCAPNADAQKPFKGIVNYSISYDGSWDAATLAQLPNSKAVQILGKRSKVENIGMGYSITEIMNGTDSSSIVIFDIPEQPGFGGLKGYYMVKKEKILETISEGKTPTINYVDESKTIAGYVCKKAEYITEDEYGEKETTVVYYNETIGGPELNFGQTFNGLKGFPMEYILETEEGKITYTTSSVQTKKVKLKDINFMIPSEYKELSEDEIKALFGGE